MNTVCAKTSLALRVRKVLWRQTNFGQRTFDGRDDQTTMPGSLTGAGLGLVKLPRHKINLFSNAINLFCDKAVVFWRKTKVFCDAANVRWHKATVFCSVIKVFCNKAEVRCNKVELF